VQGLVSQLALQIKITTHPNPFAINRAAEYSPRP
jgi:hypothetical protein